jgi:hypothetical protein
MIDHFSLGSKQTAANVIDGHRIEILTNDT